MYMKKLILLTMFTLALFSCKTAEPVTEDPVVREEPVQEKIIVRVAQGLFPRN